MAEARLLEPDLELIKEIRNTTDGNPKRCLQCASCSIVCNISPDHRPFPRKEMVMAQWGWTDGLLRDPDVWLCYQCNDCSTYCPRGAKPGDVLAAIRAYIYKKFAVPSFMGKALASPRALPVLLIVPILVLIACIFLTAPQAVGSFQFMTSDVIDFDYFIPHQTVDALFVFGLTIVYIIALFGFLRFWRLLKSSGTESKMSFIPALFKTVVDIFSHTTFYKCDVNKPRALSHILVFAGFGFSFIATLLVFILVFVPHYLTDWGIYSIHIMHWPPIEFPNIVKIFGAIGGLAIIIGGSMMLYRRWLSADEAGLAGYSDYLFLYVIFFTGLTGVLSWLFRLGDIGFLAYGSYFIHLVLVFFLLFYLPYSKFAHMVYRTLALVYARSIGRTVK
jgi:quinone-modifying oxidoreductase subunit QmoC